MSMTRPTAHSIAEGSIARASRAVATAEAWSQLAQFSVRALPARTSVAVAAELRGISARFTTTHHDRVPICFCHRGCDAGCNCIGRILFASAACQWKSDCSLLAICVHDLFDCPLELPVFDVSRISDSAWCLSRRQALQALIMQQEGRKISVAIDKLGPTTPLELESSRKSRLVTGCCLPSTSICCKRRRVSSCTIFPNMAPL